MGIRREINLATTDPDAPALAARYGLGLELDEFCTAMNMDDPALFAPLDDKIRRYGSLPRVFHAPFNELFPCAIDPKIRAVALERLEQAYALAERYGIRRMVCHGNYLPNVYFPAWYVEQSVGFWKSFLRNKPSDFRLYLENVLEPEPEYLRDIVAGVDDPRCRLCLDLGHANVACVSSVPVEHWIRVCAPLLEHLHLHNNDRSWDWHRPLGDGSLDYAALLPLLDELAPEASVTLEHPHSTGESLLFLSSTASLR